MGKNREGDMEKFKVKKFCGNCKFYLHKGQCKITKELVCIYDKGCKDYKRKWYKFWVNK